MQLRSIHECVWTGWKAWTLKQILVKGVASIWVSEITYIADMTQEQAWHSERKIRSGVIITFVNSLFVIYLYFNSKLWTDCGWANNLVSRIKVIYDSCVRNKQRWVWNYQSHQQGHIEKILSVFWKEERFPGRLCETMEKTKYLLTQDNQIKAPRMGCTLHKCNSSSQQQSVYCKQEKRETL